MDPKEIEKIPFELEKSFVALSERIMSDIIRRLKANAGEITRAADWQINRLRELGVLQDEIDKAIMDALKITEKQLQKAYDEAIESGYARNKDIYKLTGIRITPYAENIVMQQYVAAIEAQTLGEFRNITAHTGIGVITGGRTKSVSLLQYYTDTLDKAALDVTSGAFDYNTVLRRTVGELTASGIRGITYESKSGRYTSARIEVAARRAVMTGVSQVTGRISESNAAELGTDTFETTAHTGCREDHLSWQGKWFTMEQLRTVCGYGSVTGLKGANCRHDFFPVIPGVDEPIYSDKELKEIEKSEKTKKKYKDHEFTPYEATQYQRLLERKMRAARQKTKLLKEGEGNKDDIMAQKVQYRRLSAAYTEFSETFDLPQQRQRVTIDNLGKIMR